MIPNHSPQTGRWEAVSVMPRTMPRRMFSIVILEQLVVSLHAPTVQNPNR